MTLPGGPGDTPMRRSAGFFQTLKAVGWSFLGVRRRSGLEDDFQKVNPLHVIAVAVVAVLVFIVALAFFVNWVVAQPSR